MNLTINSKYNIDEAKIIMKRSPFQKLTYKKEFFMLDKDGYETNYSRIITENFGDE